MLVQPEQGDTRPARRAPQVGDKFKDNRYEVLGKLGWGHFSTVWLARDHVEGRYRALKVQKSANHYREAAKDEIRLLTEIGEGGMGEPGHCVGRRPCADPAVHRAPWPAALRATAPNLSRPRYVRSTAEALRRPLRPL